MRFQQKTGLFSSLVGGISKFCPHAAKFVLALHFPIVDHCLSSCKSLNPINPDSDRKNSTSQIWITQN